MDAKNPLQDRLCPIRQDLNGLPSLFIQSGSDEIVLSDAKRLAERAQKAGVEVSLEVWDGMWHCFQMLSSILPEAREAIAHIGSFVRRIFRMQEHD